MRVFKNKKKNKQIHKVLIGLVDLFLKVKTPIGSGTLKTHGFDKLSSATIRNCFASLEELGFLKKNHASGGRIPTDKAFEEYALFCYKDLRESKEPKSTTQFKQKISFKSKDILQNLQSGIETLGAFLSLPAFLSTPRFDHDFIREIKLLPLDKKRILSAVITDFGQIFTDIIPIENDIYKEQTSLIEEFITNRLQGKKIQIGLSKKEEIIAKYIYNEIMVRYVTHYSNFTKEDLCFSRLSSLLNYEEFSDLATLSSTLGLFENHDYMKKLLEATIKDNNIKYFIGSSLSKLLQTPPINCSVVTIPYYINHTPLGAIGVLGPTRMPYKKIFSVLKGFSSQITEHLTESLYKFKLSFRYSQNKKPQKNLILLNHNSIKLLPVKEPKHE